MATPLVSTRVTRNTEIFDTQYLDTQENNCTKMSGNARSSRCTCGGAMSAQLRNVNITDQSSGHQAAGACSKCADHYNNVRSHFSMLKRELCVEGIIDEVHKILPSDDDIEDIKNENHRRKKAELLLRKVIFHRKPACEGLVKALRNDYKHVLDMMHNDHMTHPVSSWQDIKVTSQTIRDNYEKLTTELPSEKVADLLVDYDVFTIDDHEIVMCLKARKTIAEAILNKILEMSQQSQKIFIHILQKVKPSLARMMFSVQPITTQRLTSDAVRVEVDNTGIMAMDTSDPDNLTFGLKFNITDFSGQQIVSRENDLQNSSPMDIEEILMEHIDVPMEVGEIGEGCVVIYLRPKSVKDFEKFRKMTGEKAFQDMLKEFLQLTNTSDIEINLLGGIVIKVTFVPQKSFTDEEGASQIKKAYSEEELSVEENRAYLLEELNPEPLVRILNKVNVLSVEDVEWIKQKGKIDRRSQVEKLMQVLLNRDDHAIREFKSALEGSRQGHILQHIKRKKCLGCLRQRIEENKSDVIENIEMSIVTDVISRCNEHPENLFEGKREDVMNKFIEFLKYSKEALIAFEDTMHATGDIELLGESTCQKCGEKTKSMDSDTYLKKLEENFEHLRENINAKDILETLLVRGAITYSNKCEILKEGSTVDMNSLLLKRIMERGPKACVIFFGVLFDESYESILHSMEVVHPRSMTTGKAYSTPEKARSSSKSRENALMVAAIDFGTTYSGIAYSFKVDYGKNPMHIDTINWDKKGLVSLKTPSTLLLDQNKSFAAFGYEAEEMYNQMLDDCENEEYRKWYYFKQFKMMLHKSETLNRKTTITDEVGHGLLALDIFSKSIHYLKQQLHADLDHKQADVRDKDIHWVLTVPAIWHDAAKQFMREAAEKAGIPGHQLTLALEPEAASVYVKEIALERQETGEETMLTAFSPGTKYMVLDLGGGTVDITVREVLKDRTLKELFAATGGDFGGMSVNNAVFQVLEDLLGADAIKIFKDMHKPQYHDLENDIETKKRTIKPNQSTKIGLHFPSGLREIYEQRTGKEVKNVKFEMPKYAGGVDIRNDKLRLSPKVAEGLFDSATDGIITHTKDILSQTQLKGTRDIICVGGFAECDIVINKIKQSFPEHNIIVPQDAGLAVLKGAVIYGQNPKIVSSRVIRYTYGNAVHRMFWGDYDPVDKFVSVDGKPFCRDVFNKLVEVNTSYEVGQTVSEEVMPLKADMTKMSVHLYRTRSKIPRYVTDAGCKRLGTITVDMPDTRGGLRRKVLVSLKFGDTELIVEGKDETTGSNVTTSIDLLSEI